MIRLPQLPLARQFDVIERRNERSTFATCPSVARRVRPLLHQQAIRNVIRRATTTPDVPSKSTPGYHPDSDQINPHLNIAVVKETYKLHF
ncbi:hypothetical protein MTP99_001752 [Tenebrio molitor]|nr:hypothetical protein MTP99_001752 [Tenebrio molitor]